jgi:hypothetical protein
MKSIFKIISTKYISMVNELNRKKEVRNTSFKNKGKIKNKENFKSYVKRKKNKVNNPKKKKTFNIQNIDNNKDIKEKSDTNISIAKMKKSKNKLTYIDKSKHRKKTINNIIINQYYKFSKKSKYLKEEKENGNNIINDIILSIPKAKRSNYFCDHELNELKYEHSLDIDFRGFFQLYLSSLKENHILINTFFVRNDYNIFLLKLSLFFLNFALFYFMNTLFFDDELIHKIYEEKGKYDFLYQIPKILYSIIITQIVSFLLEYLSSLQDDFLSIKEKGPKFIQNNIKKSSKSIKIKNILFFIIGLFLLFICWYFISAFNAIYNNIQFQVIKDSSISYCTSFLYPFLLISLPVGLRLISLRYKNKCLFIFGKIINKIINLF